MDYKFDFEDLSKKRLRVIKQQILNSNKIKINDLTLRHLIYFQNNPILFGNGVYLFFNNQKCIYVGKCSSRTFIQRIPAHLEMRDIPKDPNKKEIRLDSCLQLLKYKKGLNHKDAINCLLKCEIFLINFTNINDLNNYCYKLEKICKYLFNPLNELSKNIINILNDKINLNGTLLDNLNTI